MAADDDPAGRLLITLAIFSSARTTFGVGSAEPTPNMLKSISSVMLIRMPSPERRTSTFGVGVPVASGATALAISAFMAATAAVSAAFSFVESFGSLA